MEYEVDWSRLLHVAAGSAVGTVLGLTAFPRVFEYLTRRNRRRQTGTPPSEPETVRVPPPGAARSEHRLPLDGVVTAVDEVVRLKAENEKLRVFARSASDQAQKHIQDMWNPPGLPGPASAWSVLISLGARAVVLLAELGEGRTCEHAAKRST